MPLIRFAWREVAAVTGPGVLDPGLVDAVIEAFRVSPPFDALAPDLLIEVAKATREESPPTGTEILQQGGPPSTGLYLIRSGRAQVRDQGRLIDEPGPGEVFGELSLLTGSGPT